MGQRTSLSGWCGLNLPDRFLVIINDVRTGFLKVQYLCFFNVDPQKLGSGKTCNLAVLKPKSRLAKLLKIEREHDSGETLASQIMG